MIEFFIVAGLIVCDYFLIKYLDKIINFPAEDISADAGGKKSISATDNRCHGGSGLHKGGR